jgi:hypothetical protein
LVELISSDDDEGEKKEHWKSRKKQKSFYFKGHLNNVLKKLKSNIDVNIVNSSPLLKTIEYNNCVTPSVNVLSESFDSIQSDGNVTPITKILSDSLVTVKSYKSPVDGQRSNDAVYENRLPKDINYFGPVLKKNGKPLEYVVGIYNDVKDITKITELYFSDYDTLSDYTSEKNVAE